MEIKRKEEAARPEAFTFGGSMVDPKTPWNPTFRGVDPEVQHIPIRTLPSVDLQSDHWSVY